MYDERVGEKTRAAACRVAPSYFQSMSALFFFVVPLVLLAALTDRENPAFLTHFTSNISCFVLHDYVVLVSF